MVIERLIIVGAGGHARVLADVLESQGRALLGFTHADPARRGERFEGHEILGDDDMLLDPAYAGAMLLNGIGSVGEPVLRARVQRRLEARGHVFTGVRHPSAVVSSSAMLHPDVQVMAGAVVQPGAVLAAGCIVNTSATVDHDALLSEFVHVASGAVLCGSVVVGARSFIGAGAVVRQGLTLGPGTVIGAGAVVTSDFEGRGMLVGVPARPRESGSRIG